jgi:hypothetical protein
MYASTCAHACTHTQTHISKAELLTRIYRIITQKNRKHTADYSLPSVLRLRINGGINSIPPWYAKERLHTSETFFYVKTTCIMMVLDCAVTQERLDSAAAETDCYSL